MKLAAAEPSEWTEGKDSSGHVAGRQNISVTVPLEDINIVAV